MFPRSRLYYLIGIVLAFALTRSSLQAGTFGRVVPIGGHASDLALDESRGVLYVANFTANRIEVMSLADLSIQRSMNVAAQPGSLAVSPDGRFLVVTHYGNFQAPNSPNNAVTVIDLSNGSRQTFGMGTPPLGVQFGIDGKALVVTASEFISFDPVTGTTVVLDTVAGLTARTLPQPPATAPAQIVATSMGVSGDGVYIYGVTDTFQFRYDSQRGFLFAGNYTAAPPLGPRAVSVNRDGSLWAVGWTLNDSALNLVSQFPNVTGALNVGSVQIDSQRNVMYAQMGEVGATSPTLIVADLDNLATRERLHLAESLSGRSVMSSDGQIMYSVSESGVTVLPVGQLNRIPRITTTRRDLLFRGNFCDRTTAAQEIQIQSDGGLADFVIASDNPGVRISPSRGVTPATVRITVDPSAFQNQKGTTTVNLNITSTVAVNQILPVKVQVNSKEPDQRGTVFNVPGTLVDLIADPQHDRFYILRQDTNEVLVFDGATFSQIAALRTYNTPTSMTITFDRRWLLVGNDNAQLINVFDLETLQPDRPILIPDYVQSIAASANAILATTRSSGGGDNRVHRIDLATRRSRALDTLGIFENKITRDSVAVASTNGRFILIAQSDGNLMLYDSVQDTFTVSRRETTPLTGAYAASNFNKFVVGNALLNSSLVPERRFETDSGQTSGFAFVDSETGFRITSPSASAPGVLQRMDLATGRPVRPTRTMEAPLLPSTTRAFTRTLAPLNSRNAIIALTTSGFTVFPWAYDAATAPPRIDRVVNAADGTQPVAPGGLIAVLGAELSPVTQSTRQLPLPTALGETCLTVNGVPVPMFLASPERINAQLPAAVEGNTTLVLRTPGGVSDNYNLQISQAAPSIFRNRTAGPVEGVPAVVRASNGQVVTLSNPVHRGDILSIYATGLGATTPLVDAGTPAPSDPLATVVIQPFVRIGGQPVEVLFAGLAPNEVGIYQINVRVNGLVPLGMQVPIEIVQGTGLTTVPVRVVD